MNVDHNTKGTAGKAGTKGVLRPFLGIIGRNWRAMTLGALLSLLAALASIGLLSLSGWFLAASAFAGLNVATAKAFNFFLPSIGVRLFAMIRTLTRYGERIFSHEATFRILETLRGWCYRRIEPLVPARLGRLHSADLLTRIITDIDTLDNLYLRVLSPTAVALAVMALLAGFMAWFHHLIAFYASGVLILSALALPVIADRRARAAARRLNRQTARLRTHVADGLHGLAALLTFGAHTSFLKGLEDRHLALVASQRKMSTVTGMTVALIHAASGLAVVGTLYIGVQAISDGTLTGPHLVLITLAVMAGFESVGALPNAYQFLGQTRKAAGRLLEVTQPAPAVAFPAHDDALPTDCAIAFEQVDFCYPGAAADAVGGIDAAIPQGTRAAIMGPTGSGKSTLLYLLARFEDPGKGRIRLADRPLTAYSEENLRRLVCIVDQRSHIFNGTLRDNLLLASPRADDDAVREALAAVQLRTFVDQLPRGLDTWVGEAGRLLSGGQARRLAVARALLSPAPVWAFDEPTEGLDAATADAMIAVLLDRGRGKTIIMITHRAEAIDRMDQVILLDKGRMVASGSPDRLKAGNAFYNRLVRGWESPPSRA